MNSFEYFIETVASRSLVWQIFSNWWLWPKFSDIYGEIRWVECNAWEPGRRLRIEVVRPFRVSVEHVITVWFVSPKREWAGSTTASAPPSSNGCTSRRCPPAPGSGPGAEFTGIAIVVAGRPIRQLLLNFTHDWYDAFRGRM